MLAKHCTRNRFRVLRCPRYGVQCDFSEIAPACAQLFSFVFWQRGESCVQAGAAFRKVTLKFVPRATQDAKLLPPRWVWSQRWGGEAMDLKSTLPFTGCVSRTSQKKNLFTPGLDTGQQNVARQIALASCIALGTEFSATFLRLPPPAHSSSLLSSGRGERALCRRESRSRRLH